MNAFQNFASFSEEPDEVLEETAIPGLHWIRNTFVKTSEYSRIVLPNAGQGNFSAVYHGKDFADEPHGGYEVYGIHAGQDDVLTFMACDGRLMNGHFVDCRRDSPTFHKSVKIDFKGDPDRALVITRGIAHIFDHLDGMITLNQMRLYFDFGNPDMNSGFDVINVLRNTPIEQFPAVQTNRYLAPKFLCRLIRKSQRQQIRNGRNSQHSFNFMVGDKKLTLTPKA